jgi:hypothetical protein
MSISSSEMTSWNKKRSPGKEFQSKTNPEKRVENPRGIFFLQKDKKKK